MTEKGDNSNVWPNVDDYIQFAEHLRKRVSSLESIHGIGKLEKKIRAELKFMNSLKQQDVRTQQSRLKSSNLGHFASVIHAAERLPGLAGVLTPYQLPSRPDSLLVDLLAAGGHAWVKVVARKAQALHLVWAGAGQFGERDLLSQASEYLECASRHPHNFHTPKVHFAFYNQVTEPMATALERVGVCVWGERVPVDTVVLNKLDALGSDDSSCDESDDSCENRLGVARRTSGDSEDTYDDEEAMTCQNVLEPNESLRSLSTSPCSLPQGASASVSACVQKDFESQSHDYLTRKHVDSIEREEKCGLEVLGQTELSMCGKILTVSHNNDCRDEDNPSKISSAATSSTAPTYPPETSPYNFSPSEERDLFLELVVSPPDFYTFSPLPSSLSAEPLDLSLEPTQRAPTASSSSPMSPPPAGATDPVEIQRVNLDITTLIALVSSVTNGQCHLVFRDKVLTTQAREEREAPVLPVLRRFLADMQAIGKS